MYDEVKKYKEVLIVTGENDHHGPEIGFSGKSFSKEKKEIEAKKKLVREKKAKVEKRKRFMNMASALFITVAATATVVTVSYASNGETFPELFNMVQEVQVAMQEPISGNVVPGFTAEQFAQAWNDGADVVIAQMNGYDTASYDGEFGNGPEDDTNIEEVLVEETEPESEAETEESIEESEASTEEEESSAEETEESEEETIAPEETLPSSEEETTEAPTEESTEAPTTETTRNGAGTGGGGSDPIPTPTPETEPETTEAGCKHENKVLLSSRTADSTWDPSTHTCNESVQIYDLYNCDDCGNALGDIDGTLKPLADPNEVWRKGTIHIYGGSTGYTSSGVAGVVTGWLINCTRSALTPCGTTVNISAVIENVTDGTTPTAVIRITQEETGGVSCNYTVNSITGVTGYVELSEGEYQISGFAYGVNVDINLSVYIDGTDVGNGVIKLGISAPSNP